MPNLHRLLPTIAILALLPLLAQGAAAVTSVPIVNPGFDADPLADGSFEVSGITGWTTAPGFGQGIYDPTASDYFDPIPSGENVGYSNSTAGRLSQVLTTQLEANTRYVLEVEIGWNNHDPFAGYIVRLLTNDDTLLAEDDSSQMPPQGRFTTSTLVFTTGADHPKLGQSLKILLTSPGVQANFDDVRLTAEAVGVCGEELILPFFLADTTSPTGTTTLFAVRNLTGDPVLADVEYHTVDGTSQKADTLELGPFETRTVNLRDLEGELAVDQDGFARGFVRILAAGRSDRAPVLAGDFFQVDVGEDFATGDRLLRRAEICNRASIRFLDFGAGTRLTVFVAQPRGAGNADPVSFTVQVYDEAGAPVGTPQEVRTASHALELAASDFTGLAFGSLGFDFTNGSGGVAYAEYSAEGRFSVGTVSQCEEARFCEEDCCAPGAPKATTPPLFYPAGSVVDGVAIDDCEAAISDLLRSLESFHYRNACQEAYGGALPDRVLGARVVSCEVQGNGDVVAVVESCCPPPQ